MRSLSCCFSYRGRLFRNVFEFYVRMQMIKFGRSVFYYKHRDRRIVRTVIIIAFDYQIFARI